MPRWIVPSTRLGFTLTEMSAIALFAGIVAAVAIPSVYDIYLRSQAAQAFDETIAAIQEAQVQAMRLGRTCNIVVDLTAKTIDLQNPADDRGCLIGERELPDTVDINSNRVIPGTPNTLQLSFDFEGEPGFNTPQTIVVYDSRTGISDPLKQCLVISAGIGLMRTGDYTGALDVDPNPHECNT